MNTVLVVAAAFTAGVVGGWWVKAVLGNKVTAAESALKQVADEVKKA